MWHDYRILTYLIWALWVQVTYMYLLTKCVTKSRFAWLVYYSLSSICVITCRWNRFFGLPCEKCFQKMFSVENLILAYRIGISAIFTHVRKSYLTPLARAVPALGKDKKRTDARSAELLLPELLLVVNVNNIRFSDISAKHFDHQENKQTKIIRLEFKIYRLFLPNIYFFRPICVPNQPKNAPGPYEIK